MLQVLGLGDYCGRLKICQEIIMTTGRYIRGSGIRRLLLRVEDILEVFG